MAEIRHLACGRSRLTIEHVLDALGIGPDEEALYGALLDDAPQTAARLREAAGLVSPADAERALAALEDKGMVSRLPERPVAYVPIPPEISLATLLLDRQSELDRAQAAINDLSRRFQAARRGASAAETIEIVSSDQAVVRRIDLALRSARAECRVLDHPPYTVSYRPVPDVERELLRRRVRVRTVYDHAATETLGLEHLMEASRLGEEVRLVGDLSVKVWLVDDRLALMPLKSGQAAGDGGLLIVHPSALLNALSELFERVWEQAVPLPPTLPGDRAADNGHAARGRKSLSGLIVSLLAAGYTDSAIARHLGIGLRTAERRIGEVMREVNAKTRFQAGVIVGRGEATPSGGAEGPAGP